MSGKVTITLTAEEAKKLRALVETDGAGMSRVMLPVALKKRLLAGLQPPEGSAVDSDTPRTLSPTDGRRRLTARKKPDIFE